MNTIKIFLATSGRIADLRKDFPLYQGAYQNKLLNVFVPTSILSPEFRSLSAQGQVTNEYVAGTAVKIGMTYTDRSGSIKESVSRYMRYLKTLTYNNVEYALFERKLPKEFTLYAGQGTNAPILIINVVNVLTNSTVDASIAIGSNLSNLVIDKDAFETKITTSGTYNFTYSTVSTSWKLGLTNVTLANYGITVDGTPNNGDIISVRYTGAPSVLSIATSQTCALDVMPSTNLDADDTIEPSEFEVVNARLNAIDLELDAKQDRIDGGLQTDNKSVVGAINENKGNIDINRENITQNSEDISQNAQEIADLKTIVGTGEDYVGTLTVNSLPTDATLNTFVQNTKGRAPKGNDVVIVVLKVSGDSDKTYKYIYNGTTWGSFGIPPFEEASNGTLGIIEGTYNIGSANNTLIDIVGGQILNIYVKDGSNVYRNIREYLNTTTSNINKIINGTTSVGVALKAIADGLGNNIVNTYLTQTAGATKDFVREYALPREFNDTYFIDNQGYVDIAPLRDNPQFSTPTSSVGDFTLFDISKTNDNIEFELSQKNSAETKIYVSANSNADVHFRLTTYAKNSGEDWTLLSAELSNPVSLVAGEIQRVDFYSNFISLGSTVLKLALGNQFRQKLEVVTQSSTANTFNVYSNDVYPSTFNLNTQSLIIYQTSGLLGQQIVLGADGIEEQQVYNFTVQDPQSYIAYRQNGVEFLLDLHLPIVGELSLDKPVAITFGDTVYYLYNVLKGNEPTTIGALKQVDKYSDATGYRFIFKAVFFANPDLTGFAIIPTISVSDVLSLTGEEMDKYVMDGGLTNGQLTICSSGTEYEVGRIYRFKITYPSMYEWELLGEPTDETYTIAPADWTELADSEPYTFKTTVTATTTLLANTEVGTINNQPVLFANYGFVVGEITGQNVTIYSIGQPESNVSLSVRYKGV